MFVQPLGQLLGGQLPVPDRSLDQRHHIVRHLPSSAYELDTWHPLEVARYLALPREQQSVTRTLKWDGSIHSCPCENLLGCVVDVLRDEAHVIQVLARQTVGLDGVQAKLSVQIEHG